MGIMLPFLLGLVAVISLLAYRIYFHPLAHIPGPPLAKITYLYEWYYDLYRSGQFTFQLRALHDKYGMKFIYCALQPALTYRSFYRPRNSH